MNKRLTHLLIAFVFILFLIFLPRACAYLLFSQKITFSSKKELVENFGLKQKEINELYIYTNSITNNGEIYIDVRFTDNKNISYFRVKADSLEAIEQENKIISIVEADSIIEYAKATEESKIVCRNGFVKSYHNIKTNSREVDTLLNRLNWTKETLKTLKTKLDAANCISVENGMPMTIGFKRNGFYKIFDNSLTDSLINKYNDGCQYIFYKDNIVLEYGGGGVFGSQCFETYNNTEN